MSVDQIPIINASCNLLALIFLCLGFVAIKKQNKSLHIKMMLGALTSSVIFLGFYVYYHLHAEPLSYPGTGWDKTIYLFILITHIPLAALNLPAVLYLVYLAASKQFEKHKKVARFVWPTWIYVSVTGILVFVFLHLPRYI